MRLTQAEAGELERVNAARALLAFGQVGLSDHEARTVLHELHASRCNLGLGHTGECRPGSDASATAQNRAELVAELAALVCGELHNVLMLLPASAEAAGLAVAEAVVAWAEADPWPEGHEQAAAPAGEPLPSRPGGGGAAAAAHPRPESVATSPMIDSREDHGQSAIPHTGGMS